MLSVLKSALWLLQYPAFPAEFDGPFEVGAIQTRIPGSTACQIHYPTMERERERDGSKFHPYFRPKAVKGLSDYSKMSNKLLEFLSNRNHPCRINAEPLANDTFPIVLFSHGLGGCMEMYSQLCAQIASQGFWVVALEHEDGSGAFAENDQGDEVPYKRPDDSPYSREKVLNFRRPFLKKRVDETTNALDYILSVKHSSRGDDCVADMDPQLKKVLQAADRSKGVSLLGHSFGGASMVMTVREYQSRQAHDNALESPVVSLNVLDPWAFSLEDVVLQEGVRSVPTLSILSESWLQNRETDQVRQLLQNSEKVSSFYAPNSVHASFADSVTWLPGIVLRKFYMRGLNEQRFETIRAVASGCVQHIQSTLALKGEDIKEIGLEKAYHQLEPYPVLEQLQTSEKSNSDRQQDRTEEPSDTY